MVWFLGLVWKVQGSAGSGSGNSGARFSGCRILGTNSLSRISKFPCSGYPIFCPAVFRCARLSLLGWVGAFAPGWLSSEALATEVGVGFFFGLGWLLVFVLLGVHQLSPCLISIM